MTTDIDLVIPMVFPDDPVWQEEYRRCRSGKDATQHVRFRSWGTEELLVRCCLKYMPWLRCIHLLLAQESQVQGWMKELQTPPLPLPFLRPVGSKRPKAERMGGECLTDGQGAAAPRPFEGRGRGGVELRIVFHREFMPEEVLPCFNVNTIEMHLHRIPGLSEHFIYSNDDFFPLSPLNPDGFFRPAEQGGALLPCQHHDEKPYPGNPNVFHRFVKNGLDMVAADFGKRFTTTWLRGGHSMQPMLLSTVCKVCELHADRIGQSFTVSRSDRNFNQYIFPFYQHLSGQYIDHVPRRQYVGPGTPVSALAGIISDPQAGIVCLNDNEKMEDWEKRAAIVRREIAAKLSMDKKSLSRKKTIVTMTSFPARIHFVPTVLESIYAGTVQPDEVVLNLSSDEFPDGAPQDVRRYQDDGRLTICYRDGNERAFKKLIPTLRTHPDDVVVSIDDDIVYPPHFIETITREIAANGYTRPVTCGHFTWKSWGGIYSHYGGFTATMAKFYSPLLDELYDSFVKPLALTGEARYDDELYTLCALANGIRYEPSAMDLRPLRKEHRLPCSLSVHGTEEYRRLWGSWRETLRQEILKRRSIDVKPK